MSEKQEANAGRRRRTAAEIEQIKSEFVSSGMSQRAFCGSRGLSLGTLQRYLRGTGNKPRTARAASRLVAVEVAAPGLGEREANGGLRLVLRGGRKIEVDRGFDSATLGRLLAGAGAELSDVRLWSGDTHPYLAVGATDMRKSFEGLYGLVAIGWGARL